MTICGEYTLSVKVYFLKSGRISRLSRKNYKPQHKNKGLFFIKEEMCLFKKRNSAGKNLKKLIENKFNFLLEREYECQYFNRGGEEEFIFVKGVAQIEVYSFNTAFSPFAFEVVISDKGFKGDNRINLNNFLSINVEDIKKLSPIETVDYYAKIIKDNIEKIEKTILL